MVIQGITKDYGAVAYKPPRETPSNDADAEAYVMAQLYTAERAMAVTEYASHGAHEKVVAVFSFEDYSSSKSPPMPAMKESSTVLQRIYPERLKILIIYEPPFWMKALYTILYPFLSYATREKIQMKSGKVSHLIDLVSFFVP